MTEETHYGTIQIDYQDILELLHKTLQLPDNYHVWGFQEGNKCLEILVESEEIPHVEDGKPRPLIEPIYERSKDGSRRLLRIEINE